MRAQALLLAPSIGDIASALQLLFYEIRKSFAVAGTSIGR
jgi:hypothetical protein